MFVLALRIRIYLSDPWLLYYFKAFLAVNCHLVNENSIDLNLKTLMFLYHYIDLSKEDLYCPQIVSLI